MSVGTKSFIVNRGYCEKCKTIVPVQRVERDNHLFLARDCPKCGHGETLISRDAKLYYEKRELMGYTEEALRTCSLDCPSCSHNVPPSFVLVDVTNRCNMNCPICLANVQSMGFEFHPPIEYFDKVFDFLAQMDPKPVIQLFGGEPTCREDLLQIIRRAHKKDLRVRMITNGLKFADEEYCKEILVHRVQLLLGLDGVNPDIQRKLRKNPGSLTLKLRAIENIEKYSRSKITIMCTAARDTSEELIPDLIKMAYEKRHLIFRMMTLPLQSNSGPEGVGMESSTIEDVEHLMAHCFPGLEYVPVGAVQMVTNIKTTFGVNMQMGGAHPNCECLALMVGDSELREYRPVNDFLKVPYKQMVRELIALDREWTPKLEKSILARLFGTKGKKLRLGATLLRLAPRYLNIGKIIGKSPVRRIARILWDKVTKGLDFKALAAKHMRANSMLQLIILPYEEPGCLESARLVDCPVAFACEDPDTADMKLMPFCSYFLFKNDILRKSSERWGIWVGWYDEVPEGVPPVMSMEEWDEYKKQKRAAAMQVS